MVILTLSHSFGYSGMACPLRSHLTAWSTSTRNIGAHAASATSGGSGSAGSGSGAVLPVGVNLWDMKSVHASSRCCSVTSTSPSILCGTFVPLLLLPFAPICRARRCTLLASPFSSASCIYSTMPLTNLLQLPVIRCCVLCPSEYRRAPVALSTVPVSQLKCTAKSVSSLALAAMSGRLLLWLPPSDVLTAALWTRHVSLRALGGRRCRTVPSSHRALTLCRRRVSIFCNLICYIISVMKWSYFRPHRIMLRPHLTRMSDAALAHRDQDLVDLPRAAS